MLVLSQVSQVFVNCAHQATSAQIRLRRLLHVHLAPTKQVKALDHAHHAQPDQLVHLQTRILTLAALVILQRVVLLLASGKMLPKVLVPVQPVNTPILTPTSARTVRSALNALKFSQTLCPASRATIETLPPSQQSA